MPPSSESLKEQILANIVTTLEGVTGGSDYFHTIYQVKRLDTPSTSFASFPAVLVVPLSTQYDNPRSAVVGANHGSFQIQLSCFIRTATDISKQIERLIHDVHTALWVDISRGGIALNTRIVSDDVFYPSPETEPLGGVDISIEVDYRTPRTDLTTAVT